MKLTWCKADMMPTIKTNGAIGPTTIIPTCGRLLVRHRKRFVLNRPLSAAYATALMSSAKTYYNWYDRTVNR